MILAKDISKKEFIGGVYMKAKKSILFIFITVLFLIFAYNYVILPLAFQYKQPMGMGMGMEMHGRMYSHYNNYINFNRITLVSILILLSGVTLIRFYRILIRENQCSHCGYKVIDEKWTICPMCGNKLRK